MSILIIAVVSLAWLTALSVVALVPIDVYSTLARRQTGPLETLWNISYWCGLLRGLPWLHEYCKWEPR